jgi:acyl-CoA thioester hydrolase
MYISETQIRVRYGETDQMGVVYHGNYALYYEIGRTEALRQINITYRELEEGGVMMPVVSLKSEFKRSARYDDLLTIKTIFKTLPTAKTHIYYELTNEAGELISLGETVLAFVDMKTNKITRCPERLLSLFKPFFE